MPDIQCPSLLPFNIPLEIRLGIGVLGSRDLRGSNLEPPGTEQIGIEDGKTSEKHHFSAGSGFHHSAGETGNAVLV